MDPIKLDLIPQFSLRTKPKLKLFLWAELESRFKPMYALQSWLFLVSHLLCVHVWVFCQQYWWEMRPFCLYWRCQDRICVESGWMHDGKPWQNIAVRAFEKCFFVCLFFPKCTKVAMLFNVINGVKDSQLYSQLLYAFEYSSLWPNLYTWLQLNHIWFYTLIETVGRGCVLYAKFVWYQEWV